MSSFVSYNPGVSPNCDIRLDGKWTRQLGPAKRMLRCDWPYDKTKLIDASSGVMREWTHPIEALHWLGVDARADNWVGFLSYDLGRWFEKIPISTRDDLHLPLFIFTAHAFDKPKPALEGRVGAPEDPALKGRLGLRSTFTRDEYERAVQTCIDYIAAGDVFQINLSQRFTLPLTAKPQVVYERLCTNAPADYGAFLHYDDFALICNSPELFLRVTPDRQVQTRPIKGTRPRLPGMEEELRNSAKDQAELNMIVDLERNDLGRVCEIGSVRVTEPRKIEAYPTVYHGVATIEGMLKRDVTFIDLLRATFPGGSITGAPKIRAMEIIEELEPVRRGPYCGAIGYLDSDGTIEFNMAIRTMIAKDGHVHIPVGGGIVADSSPAAEYEETLVKAKAMFAAVGIDD